MKTSLFKSIQSSKGLIGIECEACKKGIRQASDSKPNLVAIVWCSPYASMKANQQLERDLKRIYMKYYIATLCENFGLFWE